MLYITEEFTLNLFHLESIDVRFDGTIIVNMISGASVGITQLQRTEIEQRIIDNYKNSSTDFYIDDYDGPDA